MSLRGTPVPSNDHGTHGRFEMATRIFSYDEARELLTEVRKATLEHQRRLSELREQLEHLQHSGAGGDASRQTGKLNEWANVVMAQWMETITALGAIPKGLWTVDFDSGRGYYFCWTYDEEHLSYYHRYEEGFIGRKPLTEKEKQAPSALN